jgi:glycine/D-amino acid oxidase-like deaminating enzyme
MRGATIGLSLEKGRLLLRRVGVCLWVRGGLRWAVRGVRPHPKWQGGGVAFGPSRATRRGWPPPPRMRSALRAASLGRRCSRSFSSGPALPTQARVVISGGGIVGTSVAYHLAKLGWTDVLLLEQHQLTAGTTWHAAGLMVTFGSLSETSTEMRKHSKELYSKTLEEETGMSTGFLPCGFIELATDAGYLEEYRRVAAFNRKCGIDVQEISPAEVEQRFPLCRTDDVLAGFYVPDDGRVNPVDATAALARGARNRGVTIVEGVAVDNVTTTNGRVSGVSTSAGHVACDVFVNAGGMWARQLAERDGITVPNQAAEHYYLITERMPEVERCANRSSGPAILLPIASRRPIASHASHRVPSRPIASHRIPSPSPSPSRPHPHPLPGGCLVARGGGPFQLHLHSARGRRPDGRPLRDRRRRVVRTHGPHSVRLQCSRAPSLLTAQGSLGVVQVRPQGADRLCLRRDRARLGAYRAVPRACNGARAGVARGEEATRTLAPLYPPPHPLTMYGRSAPRSSFAAPSPSRPTSLPSWARCPRSVTTMSPLA